MAVLWTSTKSRADIDSEDGLLVKTPTLKRPDKPIKGLDTLDIENADFIELFAQRIHLRFEGMTMLNAMAKIVEVAQEGNDCSLRFLEFHFDGKNTLSISGGSPTVIYKINMTADDIKTGAGIESFEFVMNMPLEEAKDIVNFLTKEFNICSCEICTGNPQNDEGMLDKCLLIFRSKEPNNSSMTENTEEFIHRLVLLRCFNRNMDRLPFCNNMIPDSDIEEFPVIYSSDMPVKLKTLIDAKGDYIELAQMNGTMLIKSKDPVTNLTLERFLGCPLTSNGSLPENKQSFAAIPSKDLYRALSYKQPDPLKMQIWFTESGDELQSDCVKLANKNIEVYIGQCYRMPMPKDTSFLVKKKGKFVQGTAEESLASALAKNGVRKKDQEKRLDEVLGETDTGGTEEVPQSSIDEAFAALDRARARIMDDSIKLKPGEQVSTALILEKMNDLITRIDELNKKYNEVLDQVNFLTSRVDKTAAIISTMNDMATDRLMSLKMGENEESREMESASERRRRLKREAVIRNATGCEPTKEALDMSMFPARHLGGIPIAQQVDNYVRHCGDSVVSISMMLANMPEVTQNNMAKRLSIYKTHNLAVRVNKGEYYFPSDIETRMAEWEKDKDQIMEPIVPPDPVLAAAVIETEHNIEKSLQGVSNARKFKPSPSKMKKFKH